MANRPANAGSGRGLAPTGDVAPPPVHHEAFPPAAARVPPAAVPGPPAPAAPAPAAGHRAARPGNRAARPGNRAARPGNRAARPGNRAKDPGDSGEPAATGALAWLPYLIVLAGVGAGMFVAWQGSVYAGRGTGLVGASLLAAALARLILPNRLAGVLASRRKASDVLAFAVFGAAVLAVALSLP